MEGFESRAVQQLSGCACCSRISHGSGSMGCRAAGSPHTASAHAAGQLLAHRSLGLAGLTTGMWGTAGWHRAGRHQLPQRRVVMYSLSSGRCKLGRRNGTNPVGVLLPRIVPGASARWGWWETLPIVFPWRQPHGLKCAATRCCVPVASLSCPPGLLVGLSWAGFDHCRLKDLFPQAACGARAAPNRSCIPTLESCSRNGVHGVSHLQISVCLPLKAVREAVEGAWLCP